MEKSTNQILRFAIPVFILVLAITGFIQYLSNQYNYGYMTARYVYIGKFIVSAIIMLFLIFKGNPVFASKLGLVGAILILVQNLFALCNVSDLINVGDSKILLWIVSIGFYFGGSLLFFSFIKANIIVKCLAIGATVLSFIYDIVLYNIDWNGDIESAFSTFTTANYLTLAESLLLLAAGILTYVKRPGKRIKQKAPDLI